MINQAKAIQAFLLSHIEAHPSDIVVSTMRKFNVSRTTVRRHLGYLIADNKVIMSGTTRQVRYYLASDFDRTIHVDIKKSTDEFQIWKRYFDAMVLALSRTSTYDICEYAFTKMVNNAIDHSQGKNIWITSALADDRIKFIIKDDGLGAFYTLGKVLGIDDYREIILELTKGKLTRDASNHAGEGIFFTSKSVDLFEIKANGYHYLCDNDVDDWFLSKNDGVCKGTEIIFEIALSSVKTLVSTFQAFQDIETLDFDRTHIRVDLAKLGRDSLISRSEAKRILRNLQGKFNHIMLDFSRIRIVGQGFVDEVFRVFTLQHPEIKIDYCNANEDVDFMIKRNLNN
ncbi:MAG: hypothetical protein COB66_00470 [Coxiella sp. (in: Bacteria)]|nr:MAG: hypothetical protein COB66_00470 [Coxiella sp. (in: g-proteobacteria)]